MNTISLDKQVHIYSIDTSAFYTDREKQIEDKINRLRGVKGKLKKEKDILTRFFNGTITDKKAESEYRKLYRVKRDVFVSLGGAERLEHIDREIRIVNKHIPKIKQMLIKHLQENKDIRQLRTGHINKSNIISVFESTLTRTLDMQVNQVYDDLIIVKAYYFEVLKDIVINGFTYGGEKYICFTASAGQIRTKKTVFIKESLWIKHQQSLMCGLTLKKINALGGVNVNKYFAYLALCNSATDVWDNFDIHKAIVVNDIETAVHGLVDYIDDVTYTIECKEMDISIEHTDGCGMMLPKVSRKNMMVRLPWVKGLLASFQFDKFIKEANATEPSVNHGIVEDIYGKQHDILAEGIEVIFTKSQFKMWKYYSSWQEYVDCFDKFHCLSGKCNEEPDFFPNAKLNYQMLQTLSDTTDDELKQICAKSVSKITNIVTNRNTMLSVFGATNNNLEKNSFQKCLAFYPELLSDEYSKETLKQIKKSLIKEAKAGKLDVNGKYLFIVPDMYAFCEWLFLGDKNPKGLLQNGEVFCRVYRDSKKLDCLRSPHLSRDHAVRNNIIDDKKLRWFKTSAIYISIHDLISKILQCDWDGDKSLVCADPLFIEIAERNMKGTVPLFYNMKKAAAEPVDGLKKYNGLKAAYTGGNIGAISNDITKVWNGGNINLDVIKLLCMENNFVIDHAKTLYKPTRPKHVKTLISQYTKSKLPHFFIYAKDKENHQVESSNGSIVNSIEKFIPNKKLSFTAKDIGNFDYRVLMGISDVGIDMDIVDKYNELAKKRQYQSVDDEYTNTYLRNSVIAELQDINSNVNYICDVIIKHLFCIKKSKYKGLFWICFGDVVYKNLQRNLKDGFVQCKKCGRRFAQNKKNNLEYCVKCSTYKPMETKAIKCIDCGVSVEVENKDNQTDRCDDCYTIYRKKKVKENVARFRNKVKM